MWICIVKQCHCVPRSWTVALSSSLSPLRDFIKNVLVLCLCTQKELGVLEARSSKPKGGCRLYLLRNEGRERQHAAVIWLQILTFEGGFHVARGAACHLLDKNVPSWIAMASLPSLSSAPLGPKGFLPEEVSAYLLPFVSTRGFNS